MWPEPCPPACDWAVSTLRFLEARRSICDQTTPKHRLKNVLIGIIKGTELLHDMMQDRLESCIHADSMLSLRELRYITVTGEYSHVQGYDLAVDPKILTGVNRLEELALYVDALAHHSSLFATTFAEMFLEHHV